MHCDDAALQTGVAPEQSALLRQPTQICELLHTGVGALQSALVRQATHWLAVQLSPVGHVPQETVPLQPLETFPQVKLPQACAGVFGAQHVLAVHVSPMAQVPGHAMVPPQPSDTEPH